MTSHAWPARPLVIRNGGIDALNQKPTMSTNWIDGTYEVATVNGTLVAPVGNPMPPACGKYDELNCSSIVPGTPCSRSRACPAGASVTIDAGTRSPLTMTLRLIDTAF